MNPRDACEVAYQNGYAQGLLDSGVHRVESCECVSNAKVFGLEDSIRGAKFPMSTDVSNDVVDTQGWGRARYCLST